MFVGYGVVVDDVDPLRMSVTEYLRSLAEILSAGAILPRLGSKLESSRTKDSDTRRVK